MVDTTVYIPYTHTRHICKHHYSMEDTPMCIPYTNTQDTYHIQTHKTHMHTPLLYGRYT
jgi:hypothetical protein